MYHRDREQALRILRHQQRLVGTRRNVCSEADQVQNVGAIRALENQCGRCPSLVIDINKIGNRSRVELVCGQNNFPVEFHAWSTLGKVPKCRPSLGNKALRSLVPTR